MKGEQDAICGNLLQFKEAKNSELINLQNVFCGQCIMLRMYIIYFQGNNWFDMIIRKEIANIEENLVK